MIYAKDTSPNSEGETHCASYTVWLRSLWKGVETCEDEIFTFPKAWLEVTKKQCGHDTGLKTNNKKLAGYKSRKE